MTLKDSVHPQRLNVSRRPKNFRNASAPCHERVHLRQFARHGRLLMSILYVLLPLPMGLAYCRARFEREAYEETIRAAFEVYGLAHVEDPSFRSHIVSQSSSLVLSTGPADVREDRRLTSKLKRGV